LQAVYPGCSTEPPLTPPPGIGSRAWEHDPAVQELVRGRLEVSGPATERQLAEFFQLPGSQIQTALLALEREGFVLRGRFEPGAQEVQWCERRLLARIHRLTLNRLRAEIQPVSIADYQRFLVRWQRLDPEHRAEGPDGVEAVLNLLDGFEAPAAAWEPELLALRVKDYSPQWLDQLCARGRIGWGRLTPPKTQANRPFAPIRSSPIALFSRESLPHWLNVAASRQSAVESFPTSVAAFRENAVRPFSPLDLSPDTAQVLDTLVQSGALFFDELQKRSRVLPSRVEQALAEFVTHGLVTSDNFEGLRALLLPQEKRASFSDGHHRRRHRTVSSIEFAGRWSLLRRPGSEADQDPAARDQAIEAFARTLLHRYGVVFRRLLERESLNISWFELGRVYRRLEARGEIRGGFFVSGVGGEQFALAEAIGALRTARKSEARGDLITISGADPLNLVGILTPGPRVTAITANRILLRDGVPVAALLAGQVTPLQEQAPDAPLERALRVSTMPSLLRPYYS
jgi:ATP-dependent Lhr-like helicase